MRLADWTGAFTEWTTIATVWIGVLSPSGTQMAGCCNVNAINLYEARSAGGNVTRLHEPAMHLYSLTSRVDAAVDAPGIPVALLPGGF